MKIQNGQDLKDMLTGLYNYYFSESSKSERETDDAKVAYKAGLTDGCVDAISTIYLALYGEEETLNLWHSAAVDSGGSKDDQTTGG